MLFFLLLLSLLQYVALYAVYDTKQTPCNIGKIIMNPITEAKMSNINGICITDPNHL